jgi:hypothetical protein
MSQQVPTTLLHFSVRTKYLLSLCLCLCLWTFDWPISQYVYLCTELMNNSFTALDPNSASIWGTQLVEGFCFFGFSVLRILLCYGWFDVAVCHIHSGQFGVLMGTWRRWAAWPWRCWRATSTHYNQWPLWCWDLINYMWVWSYHSIF